MLGSVFQRPGQKKAIVISVSETKLHSEYEQLLFAVCCQPGGNRLMIIQGRHSFTKNDEGILLLSVSKTRAAEMNKKLQSRCIKSSSDIQNDIITWINGH